MRGALIAEVERVEEEGGSGPPDALTALCRDSSKRSSLLTALKHIKEADVQRLHEWATNRAERVLDAAEERHREKMDPATRESCTKTAFRHALGLGFESMLQAHAQKPAAETANKASTAEVASSDAKGARYDQLSPTCVGELAATFLTVVPFFFSRSHDETEARLWSTLLMKDLLRHQRVGRGRAALDAGELSLFPAMRTFAQFVCMIPRELNYKHRIDRYAEVNVSKEILRLVLVQPGETLSSPSATPDDLLAMVPLVNQTSEWNEQKMGLGSISLHCPVKRGMTLTSDRPVWTACIAIPCKLA